MLVFVASFWACSDDEPAPANPPASTIPDFTALGEDLEHVYLYTYNAGTATGATANLTLENAIDKQFLTVRQVEEVLTFFTFSSGSFSAIQLNVRTGESRNLENVYTIDDDRSVIWGTNSEEQLYFGYYRPRGSTNFGMRVVDIANNTFVDVLLEDNVQNVYEPFYYQGKLFVTYRDVGGQYHTEVFEDGDTSIRQSLEFGGGTPSFFIEEAGDLTMITSTGGNQYLKVLYDFQTLEPFSETPFSVNRFFPPGPLDATLADERLYYLNFYAQPSPVPFGPAIYDFIRAENQIIDMIGIVQELEEASGESITLTAYDYRAEGRAFLLGYTSDFSNGLFQGGVLVISESGELLQNLETPFIPISFVKS